MRTRDRASSLDGRVATAYGAVVLAFVALHAVVLTFVAGPVTRPIWLSYVLATLAGLVLFATDRVVLRSSKPRRHRSMGARAAHAGVWFMGAATVLGVANVWYATLDPSRPVLPSIGTFSASFVVAIVFIAMAASTSSDAP